MSLLCLDAGNTRLKWGLRTPDAWLAQGVLAHDAIASLSAQLPALPARILACNVAGAAVAAHIEALAATLAVPLDWFRSSSAAAGVTNGYTTPTQLGADRWAALIGARHHHSGPALVVMAGTATTIDVLSAEGQFRGGLILPGLDLMHTVLARNTAGLPEANGHFTLLPTNTDDAIVSGALQATLGAIERMACHSASADFCVVLSGGAADALAPHLSLPVHRVAHLVLEGLAASSVW
ncbi:MAG: type III pantothenate kinase [Rhodocyclaceae bacterium]|nr:type III pantothenate kinase [Rhodocyclaceae bacterium]MDZ4214263.1 type III pantothenate kinase [Rhodocyclaceae bacterium]